MSKLPIIRNGSVLTRHDAIRTLCLTPVQIRELISLLFGVVRVSGRSIKPLVRRGLITTQADSQGRLYCQLTRLGRQVAQVLKGN